MRRLATISLVLGLGASMYKGEEPTAHPSEEKAVKKNGEKREKRQIPNEANSEARALEQKTEEFKRKMQAAADVQDELSLSEDPSYKAREQAWMVAEGVQQLIEHHVGLGEVAVEDNDADDIPEIIYKEGPCTHTIRLEKPNSNDSSSEWILYIETEDSGIQGVTSGVIRLQMGVPSEINTSLLIAYFDKFRG